jgi:hypothetical protein
MEKFREDSALATINKTLRVKMKLIDLFLLMF